MTFTATQPQVTVIIPVHNRRAYLQRCLAAVAAQSYQHLQVIVVDDASSEDIQATVAGVAWPAGMTIQVIRLSQNRGPGVSRETGRQQAKGAFIAYLDSDDLWHARFVETLVATLQTDPTCSMAYCQSLRYHTLPIAGQEALRNGYAVAQILPCALLRRPWTTSACLWSFAATQQIGPWYAGFNGEDQVYEFRAGCQQLKVVYVPEPLCYVAEGHDERLANHQNRITHSATAFLQQAAILETVGGFDDIVLRHLMVIKLWWHLTRLYGEPRSARPVRTAVIRAILKYINRQSRGFVVFLLLRVFADRLPQPFVVRLLRNAHRHAPEWQTEVKMRALCTARFAQAQQALVHQQQGQSLHPISAATSPVALAEPGCESASAEISQWATTANANCARKGK